MAIDTAWRSSSHRVIGLFVSGSALLCMLPLSSQSKTVVTDLIKSKNGRNFGLMFRRAEKSDQSTLMGADNGG